MGHKTATRANLMLFSVALLVSQLFALTVKGMKNIYTRRETVICGGSMSRMTEEEPNAPEDEVFKPVRCVVCDTEVGLQDSDEIFHFHNVIPSYS
ncbi:hypothetical protein R1flu_025317 [Riccia fluitans]|uniref:Uncharacterized protein n=1 Tax=Riccia fluitans TaxID=41844 RepID=A0ABD1XXE3_9MARC